MSRFAEASARAGRAVPDDPRVDWAKEREAAERLLSDAPAEQADSPPPASASPRPLDSVAQTFSWPPDFDLDAVDLSQDPHAREFRRPRTTMRRPAEVADQTAPSHPPPHHASAASSAPPRANATALPRRATAASSNERGTPRELVRAEVPRRIPLWMVITVGMIVLLASAALLMYWLRNREVAAGPSYLRPLESAWSVRDLPAVSELGPDCDDAIVSRAGWSSA